jgi:hypothetical protein
VAQCALGLTPGILLMDTVTSLLGVTQACPVSVAAALHSVCCVCLVNQCGAASAAADQHIHVGADSPHCGTAAAVAAGTG